MNRIWKNKRFKQQMETVLALLLMLHCGLSICLCLNTEGVALMKFRNRVERDPLGALWSWESDDHCSWFGVECLNGRVIVLSLKDLCLQGTLTPELGKLTYIKSITLRNNSFRGKIPKEIVELKELEVLDLGYNNFSGPIPSGIGNNHSSSIFLVDNNNLLGGLASVKASADDRIVAERRLLQVSNPPSTPNGQNKEAIRFPETTISPMPSQVSSPPSSVPSFSFPPSISSPPSSSFSPPPASFSPPPESLAPQPLPPISLSPPIPAPHGPNFFVWPSPGSTPSLVPHSSKSKHRAVISWAVLASGSIFIFLCLLGFFICRSSKIDMIKTWSSGSSEQLQKAFVIGVPRLQRSELITACEDFSNVIGSISDGTVYKGTLSSGVEIAVTTITVKSAELWSKTSESQYRKKVEVLSTMNHKNFVNLIGYCEEENPFTRMMVFEYAPNGTLFEHLYIKESEHLDWGTRIRIAMGMAYCLDHMHDLTPPLSLNNLHSSSVFLTEDYAAKISDFTFWNEMTATKMGSPTTEFLETSGTDPQSNVYSFGIILFELVTGKLPYSVNNDLGGDWAADYLKQLPALKDIVDPTLRFVPDEELEKLTEVIKSCVNPDPKHRPTMKEVTAKLKDITDMGPDGATPKLSPLWWAELEILSSEAR